MALKENRDLRRKNRKVRSIFPFAHNASYIEDADNVIITVKSYDMSSVLRSGNVAYFSIGNYHFSDYIELLKDKNVILRFENVDFDTNIINVYHKLYYSNLLKIQFNNCVFKKGISKLYCPNEVEFNDCTFEDDVIFNEYTREELNTRYDYLMKGANHFYDCVFRFNFNNCTFLNTVENINAKSYGSAYAFSFKNCVFNSNIDFALRGISPTIPIDEIKIFSSILKKTIASKYSKESPYSSTLYTFSDCIFNNIVDINGEVVTFDNSNIFDDMLFVDAHIMRGSGLVKASTITLNTPNDKFDFKLEANESVTLNVYGNNEHIISSPKVVYNEYDISECNNSLTGIYPNDKYRKIKNIDEERAKLLKVLTIIRDMTLKEIEDKKIDCEKKLLNKPLMK